MKKFLFFILLLVPSVSFAGSYWDDTATVTYHSVGYFGDIRLDLYNYSDSTSQYVYVRDDGGVFEYSFWGVDVDGVTVFNNYFLGRYGGGEYRVVVTEVPDATGYTIKTDIYTGDIHNDGTLVSSVTEYISTVEASLINNLNFEDISSSLLVTGGALLALMVLMFGYYRFRAVI